jgi:hypothetical protein
MFRINITALPHNLQFWSLEVLPFAQESGFSAFEACVRIIAHSPQDFGRVVMCRNIRDLHNFKPPATEEEIHASSLQFVRKLSGANRPSKANEEAFNRAVDAVAAAARELIGSLVTTAPPRDRAAEAEKARARSALRFGRTAGGAA